MERLTVAQAAERLGVSAEAVRQRIKRNTLPHEKEGRTVYVLLDTDRSRRDAGHDGDRTAPDDPLVESLKAQVELLRTELADWKEAARRKDAILMQMAQGLPELLPATTPENPSDARGGLVSASPPQSKGEPPPGTQAGSQRPWWRRIFSVT